MIVINFLRGKQHFYRFGQGGRRLERLESKFRKDFTENQEYTGKLKDMHKQSLMMEESAINKLTDALDVSKRSIYKTEHFQKPEQVKASKLIKQHYKQIINYKVPTLLEGEREKIEDKTLKWQENTLIMEEAKKFQKVYFKKKETNRLLLRENSRPSNYLPIQVLKEKGESLLEELNDKRTEFQKMISDIQGERLNRLTKGFNIAEQSDTYGYLIKSKILDTGEQVKEELFKVLADLNSNNSTQIGEIITTSNVYSVESLRVRLLSQIDLSQSVIDVSSLDIFLQKLLSQSEHQRNQIESQLYSTQKIQEYQSYLFDQFYNNDINLRYQGRLQFWMLSEEEQMKYIKYNLSKPELVFKAIQTFNQYEEGTVTYKVHSQLLQQLSTFKPESSIGYLGIIQNFNFRGLLRNIVATIEQQDDMTFSQTIYALTKLHPNSIAYLYDRLCRHLFRKMSNSLLFRLHFINTSYLAMILRDFHRLPTSASPLLQQRILQEIKLRSNQSLTIYETESFLQFIQGCYNDLQEFSSDTHFNLLKQLTQYIQPLETNSQIEFDKTSLQVMSKSILQLTKFYEVASLQKLIIKNENSIEPLIKSLNGQELALTSTMLQSINIPNTNLLVVRIKKRITQILTLKQIPIYDNDLSTIFASLVKIDTQNLFQVDLSIQDKLALQICFGRFPFKANSPQYIPYSKYLKTLNIQNASVSKETLKNAIVSLSIIKHPNKMAIFDLIYNYLKYDPLIDDLESNLKTQDKETLTMILQVYIQLGITDKYVHSIIQSLLTQILNQNSQIEQQSTLFTLLQGIFHLCSLQTKMSDLLILSSSLLVNFAKYLKVTSLTNKISVLYFLVSLTARQQTKSEIVEIVVLLNRLITSVVESSGFIVEHYYLLNLIYLQIQADEFLKQNLKNCEEFSLNHQKNKTLLLFQEKVSDKYIEDIGTERFTKAQVVQAISEECKLLNKTSLFNKFLEFNNIAIYLCDLYLPNKNLAIKLVSQNQLISYNKEKESKFLINGFEISLQFLIKQVLGVRLKFIIIEEFSRMSETKVKDVSKWNQYIRSIID